jgi:hypothetical protein
MRDPLPAAVTQEEQELLGPALFPGAEYQRALLRSSYRQELQLGELLAELRQKNAPAAPGAPAKPVKPGKPPTP